MLKHLLTSCHPSPGNENVEIVEEEHKKADDHGEGSDVLDGCQDPEGDQDQIVTGIGKGIPGTSQNGQIGGEEAGGNRQGADGKIGGV